ncbi:MAG: Holliday junction resolvase RuvX [Polyangiaceae bacterium]
MRAAAIDLGRERVGVAVADELGALAHPRAHLPGRPESALLDALAQLVEAEGIDVFVVGLPLEMSGREGPAARRARRFGAVLQTRTGRTVEFLDERLSTREAAGRLREGGRNSRAARSRIDSAAAALLLQTWLDARGGGR